MLQQSKPDDFVIATGEAHSVREFVELAAKRLGMNITWKSEGKDEQGIDENGNVIVSVDPLYFRPTEVQSLLGDASKARRDLGWKATITFNDLVNEMVENDLKIAKRDLLIKEHGFDAFDFNE